MQMTMEGFETDTHINAIIDQRPGANTEQHFPLEELPTTPDIAKRGVAQYQKVIQVLTGKARSVFVKNTRIRQCFVGSSPEYGAQTGNQLELFSPQELTHIREVLEQYASDFAIIDHNRPRNNDGSRPTLSLLNIAACEHIIRNNISIFPPDAQKDPRQWLTENPQLWWMLGEKKPGEDLVESRYGLLSGYTRESSLAFPKYWAARRKLNFTPRPLKTDLDFMNDYAENLSTSPEIRPRMENLLNMHIGTRLKSDEKLLLLNAHIVDESESGGGFLGFDVERDKKYIQTLDMVYEESGIDAIAQTYSTTKTK